MNRKSILVSLIIGIVFGAVIFYKYKTNYNDESVKGENVYFLQIGAYENYENVVKVTKLIDNYVVKEEDGVYKVIVGITKNEKNLEKLKAFYEKNDNNMYIRKEEVSNSEFINYLTKYDYLMNEATSKEAIEALNNEVINKYKETF